MNTFTGITNDLPTQPEPPTPFPVAPQQSVPTPTPQPDGQWNVPPGMQDYRPEPVIPQKKSKRWILWTVIGVVLAGVLGGGYFAYSEGYIEVPLVPVPAKRILFLASKASQDFNKMQYSVKFSVVTEPRAAYVKPLPDPNASSSSDSNSALSQNLALGQSLLPSDFNLNATFGAYIELDKKLQISKGDVTIDGSLSFGNSAYSLGIESRIIDKIMYLKLTKAPEIPSSIANVSAIENKWIKFDSSFTDSLNATNASSDNPFGTNSAASKKFTNTLLHSGFVTGIKNIGKDSFTGFTATRYQFMVDPEKLPVVMKAFAEAMQGNNITNSELQNINKQLSDPKEMAMMKALFANTTFDVWLDTKTGLPRQYAMSMVFAPPASDTTLAGKQIRIAFKATLNSYNQTIPVPVPDQTITMDQASQLLTGDSSFSLSNTVSSEQSSDENQIMTVQSLAGTLISYADSSTDGASYPATLGELAPFFGNGGAPDDVYTKQQYVYARSADKKHFTLTFELKQDNAAFNTKAGMNTLDETGTFKLVTPAVSTNINSNTNSSAVVTTNLNSNKNTSVSSTQDTDSDGLTDNAETTVYHTNPNKADTDGDGHDDKTEIVHAYDPLAANALATTQEFTNWQTPISGTTAMTITVPKGTTTIEHVDGNTLSLNFNLNQSGTYVLLYGPTLNYTNRMEYFSAPNTAFGAGYDLVPGKNNYLIWACSTGTNPSCKQASGTITR